jgi:hypothetical protein
MKPLFVLWVVFFSESVDRPDQLIPYWATDDLAQCQDMAVTFSEMPGEHVMFCLPAKTIETAREKF